jgi:hypothetical protein
MSTTISARRSHRVPFFASLAVAGVIAGAGLVGAVWHESASSTAHDQAPALTPAPPPDYAKYGDHYRHHRADLGSSHPTTGAGHIVRGLP